MLTDNEPHSLAACRPAAQHAQRLRRRCVLKACAPRAACLSSWCRPPRLMLLPAPPQPRHLRQSVPARAASCVSWRRWQAAIRAQPRQAHAMPHSGHSRARSGSSTAGGAAAAAAARVRHDCLCPALHPSRLLAQQQESLERLLHKRPPTQASTSTPSRCGSCPVWPASHPTAPQTAHGKNTSKPRQTDRPRTGGRPNRRRWRQRRRPGDTSSGERAPDSSSESIPPQPNMTLAKRVLVPSEPSYRGQEWVGGGWCLAGANVPPRAAPASGGAGLLGPAVMQTGHARACRAASKVEKARERKTGQGKAVKSLGNGSC